MSQLREQKDRFLFLDSIRGLAALYVVMHHAVLQYYFFEKNPATSKEKVLLRIFWDGHLSVNMFIVLSGFSLMLAVTKNDYLLKGGIFTFFKRRAIRIVPPYYVAVIISFLLAKSVLTDTSNGVWDISIPVNYNDLYTHLLMVHDFFVSHGSKISYSLWSISVEFRLYLFFPLLIWVWRKNGVWAALVFSFSFLILFSIVLIYGKSYYPEVNLENSGVTPYIVLFTFGMIASDVAFSPNRYAVSIRNYYKNISTATILMTFIGSMVLYKILPAIIDRILPSSAADEFILQEFKDVLFGLMAAYFLLICVVPTKSAANSKWVVRALNWKPLIFIGMFSYSLYLIHPPILKLLSKYALALINVSIFSKSCLLVCFGIPIILGIAYLFFLLFERPFLILAAKNRAKTEILAMEEPAP